MKTHPNVLTARLACGGKLGDAEIYWVESKLAELRKFEPGQLSFGGGSSLVELKNIYMVARMLQGSIVSGKLLLSASITAGDAVRYADMSGEIDRLSSFGAVETERYLSGFSSGKPRNSNDYPDIVKKHISMIAGLLEIHYSVAYANLKEKEFDLLCLAQDADELQRLCWAHLRYIINKYVPSEEVNTFRNRRLREGTDELMMVIKARTGVSLPARIMQRDNWPPVLIQPRQEAHMALFNDMSFFVENAEIAFLYYIGALLARVKLCSAPHEILRHHIKYGVQEIAAGTRTVTHKARFQSRIGARPNVYRSFAEFLRIVKNQTAAASLQPDGEIVWSDTLNERGWCPAQNVFEPQTASDLGDLAEQGLEAIAAWKNYAWDKFGVEVIFAKATPAEIFSSVVLFCSVYENSPLLPDSGLIRDLAAQL